VLYEAKGYANGGIMFNESDENGKAIYCERKAQELLKELKKTAETYESYIPSFNASKVNGLSEMIKETETFIQPLLDK